MKADFNTIKTLFLYEMRVLLRDRRTVIFSILLPIAVLPLIFFLTHKLEAAHEAKLETMIYQYAVTGPEADSARALITEGRILRADTDDAARFEEVEVDSPSVAIETGTLHFVLNALEPAEPGGLPVFRLDFRGDSDACREGQRKMAGLLEDVRRHRKESRLRDLGFPVETAEVARIEENDLATAEQVSGAALALILTPLLIFLMLTGGSVVAADTIAGEKERGTLETLLTTAATRFEIVTAKQLVILSVAIVISIIQVANILVFVSLGVMDVAEGFSVNLSPASAILLILLFLPLAVFLSSILLLLSGHAKSYKEYQITYLPVFLVSLIPALAATLPGISLRSGIALVPLANISVAVKEVMVGHYDWPMLLVTWAITLGVAVFAARRASATLSTEKLITASELDIADLTGGAALFPRHVLRWFAMLWVVIFVGSVYAGPDTSMQRQLFFNLIVVMLGGSLIMIWKYRLGVREAFALRSVRPVVWLAVLLGAPASHVVGVGVFALASLVFPVPEEVLKTFSEQLIPEGMPLWQLLFFLAILPGICEELTFRGVLLHGLRRRFHPVALCLVVGLIFGLFHISLFRLAPTTYVGVLLAAVTLMSGSVLPVMLWHALYNAVPVIMMETAIPEMEYTLWHYAVAIGVLGFAFWILWVNRLPYPGLKRTGRIKDHALPPERH